MSLKRSHHGRRMAIVSLVLVALISLPLQAVSQEGGVAVQSRRRT